MDVYGLPPFPKFDTTAPNVAVAWTKWINRLENLMVAINVTENQRKKAIMLHLAGDEVMDIFDTLQIPEPRNGENIYDLAKTALSQHFKPIQNTEYQIYMFRQAKQDKQETINQFFSRLKTLAASCQFAEADREIKSQIIQGCRDHKLRIKALSEPTWNLNKVLQVGRAMELSEEQAATMEKGEQSVNRLTKPKTGYHSSKTKSGKSKAKEQSHHPQRQSKDSETKNCWNCGKSWPHPGGRKNCSAYGKTCRKCGKSNHFESLCRSGKEHVKAVDNDSHASGNDCEYSGESDESVFGVNKNRKKTPTTYVAVNGVDLQMIVDTGATLNIVDQKAYKRLGKPSLQKHKTTAYTYGSSTAMNFVGKFTASVEKNRKITTAEFLVVEGEFGTLMSYELAVELGIINHINTAVGCEHSETETVCNKYPKVFKGLGKVKNVQVRLEVDSSVPPVASSYRRQPYHLRKKITEKIREMEKQDLIEEVTGPTPWIVPLVAVPKSNGDIRLCLDMRGPNTAIQRTRHNTPSLDDLVQVLNGASVFSKLDMNQAYHQLELHPDSRYLTTFSSPIGLRRYKRLVFGVNCASEIFQHTLSQVLQGIPGVLNMWDDILVYGSSQEEHDRNLDLVLQRLQESGITLNRAKSEFNKTEITFFGCVFSKAGMKADTKKVEAIVKTKSPTNVNEVKSFLGMTNFVSRFIPNYSTIAEPLCNLTKKDVQWKWGVKEQSAFDSLKNKLCERRILAYFDVNAETELVVDGSPVGLGAILVQNEKPVAYASRALTEVERRYSQTEREALAIVWGVEHFHLYLFGNTFTLVTDHKPLEMILNNPYSKQPARIERWNLRLSQYSYRVTYRPGKDNPADYLSRNPFASKLRDDMAENYVRFLTQNALPRAITLEEIQRETSVDITLRAVRRGIETGKWEIEKGVNISDFRTFQNIASDLTVQAEKDDDDRFVILNGNLLVVPKSMQKQVVKLAHEGHQGVVKTKQLLRQKVWFNGSAKMVEEECQHCIPCQASTHGGTSKEEIQPSELPSGSWENLSVDFIGPFSNGKYLLVVIDDYSRYPVVQPVRSTSAQSTIRKLDEIFALFGIPKIIKSDNGPPFQSEEFRKFCKTLGIKHRRITPLHPQANGTAERFMRTLGKAIRSSVTEGLDWQTELNKFLRNYRATPHSTTKISPSEAMFGKTIRTKLPEFHQQTENEISTKMKENDKKAKNQMKVNADVKNKVDKKDIDIGDTVLVKQRKMNKLTTPFDPKPLKVTDVKGTMITAGRGQKSITRNKGMFKRIPTELKEEEEEQPLEIIDIESEGETESSNPERDKSPIKENHAAEPRINAEQKSPVLRRSKRDKKPVQFKDFVRY